MRQYSKTQRRLAVGAFLITAGPVALGSAAYACQAVVTAQANPQTASAGSTITVSGSNYQAQLNGPNVAPPAVPGGPTGNTEVVVLLDERDGRQIGTAQTGTARTFSTQVTIPSDVAAGVHTLILMQWRDAARTTLVSGGPGRVSITVTAAGGSRTASEGTVAAPAPAAAATPVAGAPVIAAPAASAPAAAAAAAAQTSAASADAGTTAAPAAVAPSAAAPVESVATSPSGAATSAAPAAAAPDAAAASPAPASGAASSLGSLVPASSESSNVLPGLTLAVGLALVLLSLGAFVKSGRNVLGRDFTPLAG